MRFETVDDTAFVTGQELDDLFRLFVPYEDVSAVAAADDVLGFGPVEIDALNGCVVAVALKSPDAIRAVRMGSVE